MNKIKWPFLLIVSCAYFFIVYALFGFAYQTNDDVVMMLLASGKGFIGEPSEYLLFINVFIGYILKFLYTNWPQVVWYTLFELLLLYICFVCVLNKLLFNKTKSSFLKSISIVTFLVAYSYFIVQLQYTMVSSLVTATGYFVLFTSEKKHHNLTLCFIGVCFLFGALMRMDSFLFIQAVFLPVFLLRQFFNKPKEKRDVRIYVMMLIAFLLVGAAVLYDYTCYSNHDSGTNWKQQNQYTNTINTKHLMVNSSWQLMIKSSQQSFEKALKNAAWTHNDAMLLFRWAFFDSKLFSPERLKVFLEALDYRPGIDFDKIQRYLIHFKNNFFSKSILLIVFVLLLFWKIERRELLTFIGLFLVSVFLLGFVACYLRPIPPRVYWPIEFSCFALLMVYAQKSKPRYKQKAIGYLYIMIICYLSFTLYAVQSYYSTVEQQKQIKYIKLLNTMKELQGDVYFLDPTFPFEGVSPLSEKPFQGMFCIGFGTVLNSPAYMDRMREYRMRNLGEQMLKSGALYISNTMSKDKPEVKYLLANYFYEHLNTKVALEEKAKFEEFEIISFKPILN